MEERKPQSMMNRTGAVGPVPSPLTSHHDFAAQSTPDDLTPTKSQVASPLTHVR